MMILRLLLSSQQSQLVTHYIYCYLSSEVWSSLPLSHFSLFACVSVCWLNKYEYFNNMEMSTHRVIPLLWLLAVILIAYQEDSFYSSETVFCMINAGGDVHKLLKRSKSGSGRSSFSLPKVWFVFTSFHSALKRRKKHSYNEKCNQSSSWATKHICRVLNWFMWTLKGFYLIRKL